MEYGALTKAVKTCRECRYHDTCEHKILQQEGYLMPAMEELTMPLAMPIMRDTSTVKIYIGDGHYVEVEREKIKKQLERSLLKGLGLDYGV